MTQTTWSLTVDEEGMLTFPPELLEATGWTDDTLLEWDVSDDGTISLKSVDQTDSQYNSGLPDEI